jgi:hypothetical protein
MSTINTAAELQAFFDEHLSHLPASAKAELNILLLKDIKRDLKSGTKKTRAPKIDEEGNVIKQTLHEGMLTWRKFYKEINSKLLALTGQEKLPSMNIVRFSSVLKEAGHYYNDAGELDLDDSFILQQYNTWLALPEDLKFPNKKSSAKSSKKASAIQSSATTDVEASDVEEKPKAKPRAKKEAAPVEEARVLKTPLPSPLLEDEVKAVEEPVKKKAPAKKETKKEEEPAPVEEKPKKTVAKKTK